MPVPIHQRLLGPVRHNFAIRKAILGSFLTYTLNMSLNRVSYLESWEQHPPPFVRSTGGGAEGTEGSIISDEHGRLAPGSPDLLAQPFLSSSLPSRSIPRTVRHKLSFNPVIGRGWREPSVTFDTEEDRRSLLQWTQRFGELPEAAPEHTVDEEEIAYAPPEIVFKDPLWGVAETTPAYEVGKLKRIGTSIDII